MNTPKRRAPGTATRGLVEGIMRAIAQYNAEMGLEAPQVPRDETQGVGPADGPSRPRTSEGTD